MHEFTGKYDPERAPRIETAPMVDAEVVLFAGRTITDIAVPIGAGVGFLVIFGSFWAAVLSPPVLFVLTPKLRQTFGRGRLMHILWSLGLVRVSRVPGIYSVRDSIAEFGP
jgi:hypothetical protein